jgi:tRNA/rRNA methyltransferase
MNPLNNIRIVLVEPQTSGNIGSVCRTMMNMGLTDLAVINPHDRHDWDMARKLACHADELLEARKTFQTLEEAVAGCTVVAGTSARTGLYRDHAGLPRDIAPMVLDSAAHHKTALVFGREDTGLTTEELSLCTHIINIPSSGLYRSLNLSHAVMVCCYEIFLLADDESYQPPQERSPEANIEMRERVYARWREMMTETGFCQPQKLDHMMLGLRRIFSRGKLTDNDARILLGLAQQSLWVCDQWKKNEDNARKDPLTGLLNRRGLDDSLATEVARSERYNRPLSIILCDIDQLKEINDSEGHSAGDQTLKGVAMLFKSRLRQCDVSGRWGGDEFLIICPETSPENAAALAEDLRSNFSQNGRALSFGIASHQAKQDAEQILQAADRALYRAKDTGRNCVELES